MKSVTLVTRLTVAIALVLAVVVGCAPAPKPVHSNLPPPPEKTAGRCPGPRLPCMTKERCALDTERNCLVCQCKEGYDPDRGDDRRRDPRKVYDDQD